MFAYYMYPETKHHTIEEVSTIFDTDSRKTQKDKRWMPQDGKEESHGTSRHVE